MSALRSGGDGASPLPRERGPLVGADMEPFARRMGGLIPELQAERRGPWLWAPFGLKPLILGERAAYGLLDRGGARQASDCPVVLWDMSRGQIAPVATSLERFSALAREVPGFGPQTSRADHEAVVALDPSAPASLASLGEACLDEGDLELAREYFSRAAEAVSWWMAPAVLLHRLSRLQGRSDEAASWASMALLRRFDATGAGRFGLVPRLGPEPRVVLRSLVTWLRKEEHRVSGLSFDPAWRALRDAPDVFDAAGQRRAAEALESTGRVEEAAQRWEWLLRAEGSAMAGEQAERLYRVLGWTQAERDVTELLRFVHL